MEEDFKSLEYAAVAVEAHTTRAGFIYYDVDGIPIPLAGASSTCVCCGTPTARNSFISRFPWIDAWAKPPIRITGSHLPWLRPSARWCILDRDPASGHFAELAVRFIVEIAGQVFC